MKVRTESTVHPSNDRVLKWGVAPSPFNPPGFGATEWPKPGERQNAMAIRPTKLTPPTSSSP
jgi:hypothetical protein